MKSLIASAFMLAVSAVSAMADSLGQTQNIAFEYTASAFGLSLVKINMTFQSQDGPFQATIKTQTTGIGSIKQFGYEAISVGTVNGAFVQPQRFDQYESSVKRGKFSDRSLAISFDGNQRPAVTYDPVPTFRPGEAVTMDEATGAFDPLGFFVAMSRYVMANKTCTASGNMYDGRSLLEMSIQGQGGQGVRTRAYKGPSEYCIATPRPLKGKATRDEEEDYYAPFDMWVAQPLAGGPIIPVKMQTNFFIIPMTIELTSVSAI